MMSPLRGLLIYWILIPTADAVGYYYIAPPGLWLVAKMGGAGSSSASHLIAETEKGMERASANLL